MILRTNAYVQDAPRTLVIRPGKRRDYGWQAARSGGWYDVTVTAEDEVSFARRFAGGIETGRHSVSDPAMGT